MYKNLCKWITIVGNENPPNVEVDESNNYLNGACFWMMLNQCLLWHFIRGWWLIVYGYLVGDRRLNTRLSTPFLFDDTLLFVV